MFRQLKIKQLRHIEQIEINKLIETNGNRYEHTKIDMKGR